MGRKGTWNPHARGQGVDLDKDPTRQLSASAKRKHEMRVKKTVSTSGKTLAEIS